MSIMVQAIEKFEKALRFDMKVQDNASTDSLKRIAAKGVDKALGEACVLEQQALDAGEAPAWS